MKYIAVLDSLDRLSEEAIEDIKHTVFCGDEQARYCFDIDSIEEVTDQTRKKGKWIKSNIGGAKVCSICQAHMGLSNFKYCPNCGAEMRG